MLTQLHAILHAQLSAAGHAVWAEGCVPACSTVPYVTYRVEAAPYMHGTGSVTVTGWCRSDSSHADRLALADQLLRIVPHAGLPLWLPDALAVLYPPQRPAVSFAKSRDALGVSLCFDLVFYPRGTSGGDTNA